MANNIARSELSKVGSDAFPVETRVGVYIEQPIGGMAVKGVWRRTRLFATGMVMEAPFYRSDAVYIWPDDPISSREDGNWKEPHPRWFSSGPKVFDLSDPEGTTFRFAVEPIEPNQG